jgi:integrase
MKLTAKRVLKLAKIPGRHPDGNGLYLQVINPSNVSWLFRYRYGGRERYAGLGPLHTIGLADARERAKQARTLLLDGVDPLEQRKAAKVQRALEAARSMSFEQAARAWHAQHERAWKNPKHTLNTLNSLVTYAFPKIGALPVGAIGTGEVLRVLEPIWHDKTDTASRLRGRIEAILAWAQVRGYRSGDNPARWSSHLDQTLPAPSKVTKVAHHPALPYRELPAFLAELRQQKGVGARALEFLILTCARTGEAIGARWDEFDFDAGIWVIPEQRMKSGRTHRVPLAPRSLEILRSVYREANNPYVFIGAKAGAGLSDMALTTVLRRMGRTAITVHGFRSTARDWMAEQTSFAREICEMALAHAIGDKTEAAYLRSDLLAKRFALANAWASYCTRQPGEGEVVPLRARP